MPCVKPHYAYVAYHMSVCRLMRCVRGLGFHQLGKVSRQRAAKAQHEQRSHRSPQHNRVLHAAAYLGMTAGGSKYITINILLKLVCSVIANVGTWDHDECC